MNHISVHEGPGTRVRNVLIPVYRITRRMDRNSCIDTRVITYYCAASEKLFYFLFKHLYLMKIKPKIENESTYNELK